MIKMDKLLEKLGSKSWKAMSGEEWATAIRSLIREDKEHEWAVNRQASDSALISSFPLLGTSRALGLDPRHTGEFGEMVVASLELKRIRGIARQSLRRGFSLIISELTATQAADREKALQEAVTFGWLIRGVLQKDAIDKVLALPNLSEDFRKELKRIRRSLR